MDLEITSQTDKDKYMISLIHESKRMTQMLLIIKQKKKKKKNRLTDLSTNMVTKEER